MIFMVKDGVNTQQEYCEVPSNQEPFQEGCNTDAWHSAVAGLLSARALLDQIASTSDFETSSSADKM